MDNKKIMEGKIQNDKELVMERKSMTLLAMHSNYLEEKELLRNKDVMMIPKYVDIILCEFSIGVDCMK
jgi:hypothetical protein